MRTIDVTDSPRLLESRMRADRHYVRALGAWVIVVCLACSDDTTSPPPTPRTLEIVEGDGQQAPTGVPLSTSLRVRVVGSDDQPLAGAPVQWTATVGGATITPAQSITNDDGLAETHVVLESIGNVLVSALVPGVLPVIFSLTGLDPCDFNSWPMIEVGTVVAGSFQPSDCQGFDGRRYDLYPFSLSTERAVILGVRSATFDPQVQLYSNEPWYYFNNDSVNATRDAWTKAILPPGWYGLAATSIEPALGSYQVRLIPTTASQESCEFVMVLVGVATTQNLASTDCADPSGRPEDRFWLVLMEGETVTLTQSSRHVTPHIRLILNEEVVAEADGTETGPATLTYTSNSFSNYWIHVSSSGAQQLGEYTLFITRGDGASTSLSSSRDVGPLGRPDIRDRAILGVRPGSVGHGAAALRR
jgi:hypothetical protein